MRMIQIGAGSWGASWAGVVTASPHWELVALVDLDEGTLTKAADASGLPPGARFRSLKDAVAAVEADAVLVVVPPPLHAAVALEGLEGGFHCLVEKPLATSIGEARELVKRADELRRTLMASQNFRFDHGYRTVQRLVADGAVGEVEAVYVDFRRAPVFIGFRLEMEEPLLIDMAVHHLDQIRGLFPSEPFRIEARSFNPSWSPFHGNAAATVDLTTKRGAAVSYAGSWVARGPETTWNGDWRLEGASGAILWRGDSVELFPVDAPSQGRLGRVARRRDTRIPVARLAEEGRSGVLAEFAAAITEGREPETSGRDNLGTLELVFAAVESARSGMPIVLSG